MIYMFFRPNEFVKIIFFTLQSRIFIVYKVSLALLFHSAKMILSSIKSLLIGRDLTAMKILLVAINAKYIHSNPAVHSLRSCAGEYKSCIEIAEFTINQTPSFILQEIYKRHPDVIAFSCYIWNRDMIDAFIPDLHRVLPHADIWAGGPEVSYDAAETAARWGLRGVMTGPGEAAFARLTTAYGTGTSRELPAVLDGNSIPRLKLDEIPFWYEDMQDFENRIIYYESSRGCPFSCSYCFSSIDRAMDFRGTERVCLELDYFLEKRVPQVKFIDRTFNCKKEHALPILRHILDHDNGVTNFHFEIAADLLDEDYFAILEELRPGAVQLEIGVQSTCRETIAEIRRKTDFDKVAAVVRRVSSRKNIHIHLDLIAGLPFEDLQRFRCSFNDVYALRPQQLQLGFLKVLKGSEMERQAPVYDLAYTSRPPYEVLSTRWLSYEDICRLKQIEEMVEIYYNSGQFAHTLEFMITLFESAFSMYESLAAWYEKHELFGVQSSRIRKYEILLEWGTACIADISRTQALREYLLYDLYLRENMKNRPVFAPSLAPWKDAVHHVLHRESREHTLFPELADRDYRELTKALHTEIFTYIYDEPTLVLFGYEHRNPLTNNGIAIGVPLK